MPRTLALIGLPGGGKSTVGRQLARRLQRTFIDTDAVIEQRLGCSIKAFFEREGESAFRDIESQVVADCAALDGVVMATGGGAVLRASNRDTLRAQCDVIYLRSTPEELYRRLRHDTQRPLLQVEDPMGRLRELFTERDPLYREVAGFIVDTGRPSVPTLVTLLLGRLELAGAVTPGGPAESVGTPATPGHE